MRTRQRFRPDARESLLFELLTVMRARGIPFEPDMQLQAPTTIQTLLDQGRLPLIVVTNHTGFRATTRSLLRNGLPVTLVTDTLPPEELTRRYRSILEKYPKFSMVPKDRYCLAALRKALRNGCTISCAADYQDPITKTYSLVSPAIFEFAQRMDIELLWAKTIVNDDGSLTSLLDGPHRVSDPIASTRRFIDFLNAGRHRPRSFRIAYPSST